jgi:hypothetical protein
MTPQDQRAVSSFGQLPRLSSSAVSLKGCAERLMRTVKAEAVDLSEYHDFADTRRQLGRFLGDLYNRQRFHASLR